MTTIDSITLEPADLVSKWGFDDGDLGGEHLHQWASTGPFAAIYQPNDPDFYDQPLQMYLSASTMLWALALRYLTPVLPSGCRFVRIVTIHNSIRVEPSLPENDPEYELACARLEQQLSELDPVVVTGDQIAEICTSLFPPRPRGWLSLFDAMWRGVSLIVALRNEFDPSGDLMGRDTNRMLAAYVDAKASEHNDDELFLAGEMLAGETRGYRETTADVERHLHASRTLLRG